VIYETSERAEEELAGKWVIYLNIIYRIV